MQSNICSALNANFIVDKLMVKTSSAQQNEEITWFPNLHKCLISFYAY